LNANWSLGSHYFPHCYDGGGEFPAIFLSERGTKNKIPIVSVIVHQKQVENNEVKEGRE
jgi:hypothetical protein